MPRAPKRSGRHSDSPLETLVTQIDQRSSDAAAPDTVPTGFPSLDKVLAGGLRQKDLIILAGDVGSGKSALGLEMGIRAAGQQIPTLFLSGEMSAERVLERALAMEGRASIDDLRQGRLDETTRSSVGAAAVRLRHTPLLVRPLTGAHFDEVRTAVDIVPRRRLLIVDSLQLTAPPRPAARSQERLALAVRALKALAVEWDLALLVMAQLPGHRASRTDPRPILDDLGGFGAIKQNADVILMIYREEMYRPGQGVEGATELIVAKNRNGATGTIKLKLYKGRAEFEAAEKRVAEASRRKRVRQIGLIEKIPALRRVVVSGQRHQSSRRVRRARPVAERQPDPPDRGPYAYSLGAQLGREQHGEQRQRRRQHAGRRYAHEDPCGDHLPDRLRGGGQDGRGGEADEARQEHPPPPEPIGQPTADEQ